MTQDPIREFELRRAKNISAQGEDQALVASSVRWIADTAATQYSYGFTALGRPIIQFPQDMVALQEIIWEVRPDLIIETGIAHGGSLIWSASMLALVEYCDAAESGRVLDPAVPASTVLGIDIDIREHNRSAIEGHPMASRISMLQGSSVDPDIVDQVRAVAAEHERVLVILDSNHTHEHVLAELEAYAPLASIGSYCIVFDTIVEDLPASLYPDRPWGPGDNPKTAVHAYLDAVGSGGPTFEIDKQVEGKLLITVAPDGYLRRTL